MADPELKMIACVREPLKPDYFTVTYLFHSRHGNLSLNQEQNLL